MKNLLNIDQINEVINDKYTCEMTTVPERGHYSQFLGKINFKPTTKAQAVKQIKYISNVGFDNLLMVGEYRSVERFLNDNGFKGQYTLTKSKTMCRLDNVSDYVSALEKQFGI